MHKCVETIASQQPLKQILKRVLLIKYSVECSSKIGRGVQWPDFALHTCDITCQ